MADGKRVCQKMIKAILFDAYGTLISTGSGSVEACRRILHKVGSDADAAGFYARWKELFGDMRDAGTFQTTREIFTRSLDRLFKEYRIPGDSHEVVQIMLESLYDRRVYADTRAALDYLSRHYRVYICSNTDTDPLMQNLEYNGLSFDGIFTSESLRYYKPDTRFFATILTSIQLPPEEAIYIGDSLLDDVAGAQQAGLKAMLLDRKATFNLSKSTIRPDRVITSLDVEQLAGLGF